jgi:hypothetical protein
MYLLQLHPFVGALSLFAPLAGLVVYCFLQYQLFLILKGATSIFGIHIAYESFKWDDLSYAIQSKAITTISPHVLRFNQEYKYGQRFEDYIPKEEKKKMLKHRKEFDFENNQVELVDINTLKNIYDLGPFRNLKNVFFGKRLR